MTIEPRSGPGRGTEREPGDRLATDIFLSYSSQDELVARSLQRELVAEGYSVFWDQQVPPGQDWDHWIRARLAESRLVIVLWSRVSLRSPNVRHEAMLSMEAGKLLPILIEEIKATDLPMGLYLLQSLKLVGGPEQHPEGLALLLAALRVRLVPASRPPHTASRSAIAPGAREHRATTSGATTVSPAPSGAKPFPMLLAIGAIGAMGMFFGIGLFVVFGTHLLDSRQGAALALRNQPAEPAQAPVVTELPPSNRPETPTPHHPEASAPPSDTAAAEPPAPARPEPVPTPAEEPHESAVVAGQSYVQLGSVNSEADARDQARKQARILNREVCFYSSNSVFATAIRLPTQEAEEFRARLIEQPLRGIASPSVVPGRTYALRGCEQAP